MSAELVIAGRSFRSRLIVGTGKYRSFQEMARAHEASGADMVTVAVRRVNLTDRSKESLLDYIDRAKLFILPNTAGCYSADEAIRTARLGREVGLSEWVKLEVIGDEQTLFPDTEELIRATKALVSEGFIVLPYTSDDLIVARKLVDAGAAAVMPLGAPIGSGMGIQNVANLRILRERITEVPLIVDAGVGTASDATVAMELGADGVLMNTAIAGARHKVLSVVAARRHASRATVPLSRWNFLRFGHRSLAPEESPIKRNRHNHNPPRCRNLRPRLALPRSGIHHRSALGTRHRSAARGYLEHHRIFHDAHGRGLLLHAEARHQHSPGHRRRRGHRHGDAACLDHSPPALAALVSRVVYQRRPHLQQAAAVALSTFSLDRVFIRGLGHRFPDFQRVDA